MAHEIGEAIRAKDEPRATALMRRIEDDARKIRRYFEPVWSLNRGFYIGNQSLRIRGGRLVPDRRTIKRDLFYSNQILPRVRATVASLTAHRPTFQAVVADEDDSAAKVSSTLGNEILEAERHHLSLDREVRKAVLYANLTGQGYILAGYDKNLGPVIDGRKCVSCGAYFVGKAECPTCPQTNTESLDGMMPMEPRVEVIRIRKGDLFIKAISPWQVLWDPTAECEADAEWVSIEHFMSKERAIARHGGAFEEESVDMGIDVFPGPTALSAEPKRNAVVIHESIWRPSLDYPTGLRVLWHKDRVLSWAEECGPDGDLPIAVISADDVPGRFYRKAPVEDLIPLQIRFNEQMERLFKLSDLAANPRVMADEGSIADGEPYVSEKEGQANYTWIRKTARRYPEFERPPLVSPIFTELLDRLSNQMDFIAQQYAPSRGEPGRSVTSGLQARLLIERTTTSLGALSASIEEAVARIGRIILLSAQRHFDEERVLSFAGEYGKPKVVRFRGADLQGISDVRVVPGSAFPESREARRDFLLDLASKIVTEPEQRKALVEAMGMAVRFPPDPEATIKAQVADENDRIAKGEDVQVTRADFHQIHVREHRIYQASEEYRALPQERRQNVEEHVTRHETLLAGEEALQIARQRTIAAVAANAAPVAGEEPAQTEPGGIQ